MCGFQDKKNARKDACTHLKGLCVKRKKKKKRGITEGGSTVGADE